MKTMNRQRRARLAATVLLLVGAAATVALTLAALNENVNAFHPPASIVGGEAPVNTSIRAGGMVAEGSVQRDATGLAVSFVVTDHQGADYPVRYHGILPDLFREGQGVLVTGELTAAGVFEAREVLARHDENYMPPELADMAVHQGAAPR